MSRMQSAKSNRAINFWMQVTSLAQQDSLSEYPYDCSFEVRWASFLQKGFIIGSTVSKLREAESKDSYSIGAMNSANRGMSIVFWMIFGLSVSPIRPENCIRKWTTQVADFFEPISSIVDSRCRNDTLDCLEAAKNLSNIWAISMIDAAGKYPAGILSGNIRSMGNFDQCLKVRHPDNEYVGKYCLARLNYSVHGENQAIILKYIDLVTAGRRLLELGDDWDKGTLILPTYSRSELAVCLPSTCSARDVAIMTEDAIRRATFETGVQVAVSLDDDLCYTTLRTEPFTGVDYFVTFICGTLVTFTIVGSASSIITNVQKRNGVLPKILRAFSIVDNWKHLTNLGPPPNDAITCLEGMRTLSTVWVVMTHQTMLIGQLAYVNKLETMQTHNDYGYYAIWNSYFNVDTFLFVSGLLRAYNLTKELEQGRANYLKSGLQRYLRLTPSYLVVIIFYVSYFDRLDVGPTWNIYVGRNVEACRRYWWHNLLYINNYVPGNDKCLLQSWYLSADMQLYLVAPLLVYSLWKWKLVGKILSTIAVTVSIVLPFLTTWINEFPGTYMFTVRNSVLNSYAHDLYMATHDRMSPYLVGILLGHLFHLKKSPSLAKWKVAVGWTVSLTVMYACVYGAKDMTSFQHTYNLLESALYGGLHRFAWAVAVAWVVYACHVGYGGPVNAFLSCNAFRFLGRLSYCVFLTHLAVLLYNAAVLQVPRQLHTYISKSTTNGYSTKTLDFPDLYLDPRCVNGIKNDESMKWFSILTLVILSVNCPEPVACTGKYYWSNGDEADSGSGGSSYNHRGGVGSVVIARIWEWWCLPRTMLETRVYIRRRSRSDNSSVKMRAVSLVVLYGLCLNVPAQSTAILASCTGAVTGSDTINASSVRRPVTSGLNLTHNQTLAVPKHAFQKNISDLLDDDDDVDDELVASPGQDFNHLSLGPSAPQNWITQVISTLTPLPDNLGIACQRDTQTYLQELSNFTHWAVRMMDASAKFPHGILMGNIRSMGDFDECLWTETDQEIEPKYCLASVYNLDVKNTYPVYDKLQEIVRTMTIGRMNMETYETTMGTIPMQRSGRIEWAMCIPATCSPVDVEIMLNAAGKRIFPELDIRATVHSKDCYTNSQPQGFSLRDKLILLSMMVIVSLVVVGTLRDHDGANNNNNNNNQDEEKPLGVKVLDAFSLKRSWKNLTDFSPSRSSRQIECLDGLRGISSLWVVMGHQALLASSSPYSDKVTFFNTQQYTILMILWNFFLPVDTFLVIGGLVRCYNLIPGLEKRTVNHWKSAITRYLRLTPALLVVIGLYVSVMYRISNGPLWNRHVGENKVACEWNWWKTVFYVNNYIYNEREGYHLCLLQSWYTSVDMQLYLLAPLLIVPLWRNPKLGMPLLITVAGIATAVEYATIVLNKLPGLPITMHSDDIAILTYVRTFYFVSHTRAMPYLIGIATGYLMHRYKTITLSKTLLTIGWPLAMLGLFWPLFGSLGYLAIDYPLGSWRHAYFGAFHKSVWAVAISWIIVACHNGYGGAINAFLSSRVLKFLSRISYSVFLLHMAILLCFTGYLRVPKHTDFPSIMKEMVGELSVVITLSIILHLSVEAPFAELSQIVFRKTKREVKKLK
ncbi:uncharacterized protein LOC124412737 [Diprion similis]|uniref:uncharacterized protein LOC124412737 n=1 Tax=Diprion similis TaxID=362088 RepID=UPI001EF7D43B|nr:uncharacterized protein LOC124412737 [Diprion similis]